MILVAANPYRGATRPRERVQALAAALAGVRCVVAAGGDGTTAAVINELAADVPLAVLPLGNENVFARALALPDDPIGLARVIAAGRTRRLDLGSSTAIRGASRRSPSRRGRLRARW